MIRIDVDPLVLHAAVRYALGRRTYVPAVIAAEVRRCWPRTTANWRRMVIRDVAEALHDHETGHRSLGDDCDVDVWRMLADWMQP